MPSLRATCFDIPGSYQQWLNSADCCMHASSFCVHICPLNVNIVKFVESMHGAYSKTNHCLTLQQSQEAWRFLRHEILLILMLAALCIQQIHWSKVNSWALVWRSLATFCLGTNVFVMHGFVNMLFAWWHLMLGYFCWYDHITLSSWCFVCEWLSLTKIAFQFRRLNPAPSKWIHVNRS